MAKHACGACGDPAVATIRSHEGLTPSRSWHLCHQHLLTLEAMIDGTISDLTFEVAAERSGRSLQDVEYEAGKDR